MPFQLTNYFAVLALTALVDLIVVSISWHRRASTLARTYFSLMMVAAAIYAIVAALEAGVVELSTKMFWSTLEYVGSGGVIVFFLLFTKAFVHERQKFSLSEIGRLSILPLLNVILVATNSWHHWVWLSVTPGPPGSNLAIYEHGPGYFWAIACVYLYVLRGIQLLARPILSTNVLRRQQALLLLLGSLIPFASSALYSLDITPVGLNLTPMSFMATGVFFFWALFRMGVFEELPIAREMLIEHLWDGVLVVDVKHRIVDINPRGRSLTGLSTDCVGRSLHHILHEPELLTHYDKGIEGPLELWLSLDVPRYVTIQISTLVDYRGNIHGRLIVLHDITERYAAEVELRQANDCLQRQLEEIQFLQAKLQNQANRDQLTGLFNRHYLSETLPKELQRARAVGYPVGFIMLDIDYFKRINDTFGHRAGDLVLQSFSEILTHHIRAVDIPCRLGGEEFLLVLPGITLDKVYERAEAIRQAFQDSAVPWNTSAIKTTVSGGIAVFPNDGSSDDDLLQAADLALYAAKASGRNSIVYFHHSMRVL